MLSRSVIALFCDDIREEKTGAVTLIGIYPDNINVPAFPFVFPKLAIYTRINMDVHDSLGKILIRISAPGKEAELLTEIDEETIAKSQMNVKKQGSPILGFINQIVAAPYVVTESGQVKITAKIEDVEYIGGVLNFRQRP